jgi:predicted nucleotidyltransferase
MEKSVIFKKINENIKSCLSDDYRILLFGSWAKGNALETSDIDIGIMGKEKVPRDIMVKILEKAEEIPTLRSIDIVDLNAVGENFRKSALRHAKVLR